MEPVSKSILVDQTFSVITSGTAALGYHYKNGTTMAGATSASYTTPAETVSDNGAQFSVAVSNSAGNVSSVLAGQTYYYVATAVASGNTERTYSIQVVASIPTP